MTYELHRHDAANVSTLLAPESVDLIVTSPPYFALRSYQDGGEHYDGQIGSEATPTEFLDALVACTADWVRVLRPGGSIFVNLGDKYAGSGGNNNSNLGERATRRGPSSYSKANEVAPGRYAKDKSLMGLPWRYAIRCTDELGLILRAEIVWSKPNGLPESVTDRVRRSHEQWFHLTKQGRYFAAIDEVREAHAPHTSYMADWNDRLHGGAYTRGTVNPDRQDGGDLPASRDLNPLGKVPGSVWSIPSEPLVVPDELGVDHFAAFPSEWPRRIILGWSPSGYCTVCGEPRRAVVDVGTELVGVDRGGNRKGQIVDPGYKGNPGIPGMFYERTITGYACACLCYSCRNGGAPSCGHVMDDAPPTRPAVVLDPFAGTGHRPRRRPPARPPRDRYRPVRRLPPARRMALLERHPAPRQGARPQRHPEPEAAGDRRATRPVR